MAGQVMFDGLECFDTGTVGLSILQIVKGLERDLALHRWKNPGGQDWRTMMRSSLGRRRGCECGCGKEYKADVFIILMRQSEIWRGGCAVT